MAVPSSRHTVIVDVVVNTLSVVGGLCIIGVIAASSSMRKMRHGLIFGLALSDIVQALAVRTQTLCGWLRAHAKVAGPCPIDIDFNPRSNTARLCSMSGVRFLLPHSCYRQQLVDSGYRRSDICDSRSPLVKAVNSLQ